jgi:3,4-dihydroxy 2-butanone 4-phosphate synthase / GTP cyclohydrolase II
MIRYTSGMLCAAITPERTADLDLPLMVDKTDDPRGTAFTISIDLKYATTTGISAADRVATLPLKSRGTTLSRGDPCPT